MSANRLAALTGVAFVVLLVVGGAIAGEPPSPDDGVDEIVDFYTENDSSVMIGSVIQALGLVALVFFGGYLRRVFQEAAGPNHTLPSVVQAGAAIVAVGGAIDATINFALADSIEDVDPVAAQALVMLWNNDWIPIAVGGMTLILASGLSILRHGGLPRWMGWVAIVLAVAMATPAGFVAFLLIGLWIIVASIMLALRADSPAAA